MSYHPENRLLALIAACVCASLRFAVATDIPCGLAPSIMVKVSEELQIEIVNGALNLQFSDNSLRVDAYENSLSMVEAMKISAKPLIVEFRGTLKYHHQNASEDSSEEVFEVLYDRISGIAGDIYGSIIAQENRYCRIVLFPVVGTSLNLNLEVEKKIRKRATRCVQNEICRRIAKKTNGRDDDYGLPRMENGNGLEENDFLYAYITKLPWIHSIFNDITGSNYDGDDITNDDEDLFSGDFAIEAESLSTETATPATVSNTEQGACRATAMQRSINTFADIGLTETLKVLQSLYDGMIPVPDLNVTVPTFISTTTVALTNGSVSKIQGFQRTSDIILSKNSKNYTMTVEFVTSSVHVGFQKYKLPSAWMPSGRLTSDVANVTLVVQIAANYEESPCLLSLAYVKVLNIGKVNINFPDSGLFDGLANGLFSALSVVMSGTIRKIIEDNLAMVVRQLLAEFACPTPSL